MVKGRYIKEEIEHGCSRSGSGNQVSDTNRHKVDTAFLSHNNATDALRTEKRNNVDLNGLWG
jgi:hypothetical protein